MNQNLTAQQLADLRADGRAASEAGQQATPGTSLTWHGILAAAGKPGESTRALRIAADAFHLGYDLHAQGLTDVIDALEAEGAHVFEVSSLGGNVRCVRVRAGEESEWLVTGEGPGALIVSRYHAGDVDAVDSLDPITCDTDQTADDALALIRAERAGTDYDGN